MSTASPTPNPSLYELGEALTQAFAEVDAMLAASEGEYTPEMAAIIDAAELAFEDKVERVALRYRSQLAVAATIEAEESRLHARRKAVERDAEWLRTYLGDSLVAHGKTKVRRPLATVRIQQNPPSASSTVSLEVLEVVAPDWVRSTTKLSLDKEAILAAHREGKELPPEIVVTRSSSVRIS